MASSHLMPLFCVRCWYVQSTSSVRSLQKPWRRRPSQARSQERQRDPVFCVLKVPAAQAWPPAALPEKPWRRRPGQARSQERQRDPVFCVLKVPAAQAWQQLFQRSTSSAFQSSAFDLRQPRRARPRRRMRRARLSRRSCATRCSDAQCLSQGTKFCIGIRAGITA